MSTKIEIPSSLRRITLGRSEIRAAGRTLGELLNDADRQYPGFKAGVSDDSGGIRKFVAIFVDGKDARTLQGQATVLSGSEEVTIVTAIAGG